uniref:Uncharacterized protein n=1 Tax=Solanum tuberosum TaxID=4113 RepID=M1A722_SOLTU
MSLTFLGCRNVAHRPRHKAKPEITKTRVRDVFLTKKPQDFPDCSSFTLNGNSASKSGTVEVLSQ